MITKGSEKDGKSERWKDVEGRGRDAGGSGEEK